MDFPLPLETTTAIAGFLGSSAPSQTPTAAASQAPASCDYPAALYRMCPRAEISGTLESRTGRFEIGEMLGYGGMGIVYRGRALSGGPDVAVKIMSSALRGDAGLRRRFEREARIGAAIHHPGVVFVFDSGSVDGTPFLVMELVEGSTLHDDLRKRPLPPGPLVDAAHRLADALGAIHRAGFVHRDVKPNNVMLTREGGVKLVDLGLAAPAGGSERDFPSVADATVPGAILGTVQYMSPEQARGETLHGASDQFSFGVVLYEAATGRNPFCRRSLAETIAAILYEDPPPPSGNERFNEIVGRCLAKKPQDRFASTEDLAEMLRVLAGRDREIA